jgi:hypothetical protein
MGSGGGGTKVVQPKPWVGDMAVATGGGLPWAPDTQYPGIWGEATKLYKQGTPQYPYHIRPVADIQAGEKKFLDYVYSAAPQIEQAGQTGLGQALNFASRTSPQGQQMVSGAMGNLGSIARQPAFGGMGNYGGWRGTLDDMARGTMDPNAGEHAYIGNIGDWRGTVGQQSTGEINPYINPWVLAAQNQAFRGANRAAGLTQDTFNLGARTATDAFDRAQLGALGTYQRATQPVLSDLQDTLSTYNRDFQEQVLPAIRSQASGVGGYGGSRQGIAEGIASRGHAEQMDRAIGRIGQGFGLGAGQLGEGLGLGASQLGSNLGLGARQGAMDVYRLGSQAAEQAGDIGAGMYGSAFENAQGRALQAAGLGANMSQAQAGFDQRGIDNARMAYEADMARRMSSAQMGIDAGRINEMLRQQGIVNMGNINLGMGNLGRGLMSDANQVAIAGMNAIPGMAGIMQAPMGMYGSAGQFERGLDQARIDAQIAKHYYPYESQWNHLGNYGQAINMFRPGAQPQQVIQSGRSPLGSMIGGGMTGAGLGLAANAGMPWTIGLGAAGALGGLF